VLFAWNDMVQSRSGASPNFSFYDDIVSQIPAGVQALVVITGVPSWFSDSTLWIGGNPRTTFVELWVKKVVARYGGNGGIIGFQIWNEPNMGSNPDNSLLGMANDPVNYVEMLATAFSVAKDIAPSKLVLNAATTAINQNFEGTLNYNKAMRDAGVVSFVDVYAFHYYGKQFERFVSGIDSFLRGIGKPLWATESGQQGVNKQLEYGERVWPFLLEELPNLQRVFIYQFAETSSPDNTFGLRNPSAEFPVSDLYINLRDR